MSGALSENPTCANDSDLRKPQPDTGAIFIPGAGAAALAFTAMMGKLFDVPRRALTGMSALLALAAVIVLPAMADSTMQPLPASAPAAEFSAERALEHLERFATRPRPIGSPASEQARDHLVGQLRAAGLDVRIQRAVGANSSMGLASFGQVDNVVATRRGTDSTGTVVITTTPPPWDRARPTTRRP